jgi:hypothetical protein
VKSSNKVLIGFAIGIAALVIVTVVLVVTLGQRNAPLLSENTPQGTVQRYLQDIQNKDYAAAYQYIAPVPTPADTSKVPPEAFPAPPFDSWLMSAQNTANFTWKASLGNTQITGDSASVELLAEVFRPSGPFGDPVHTNNVTFFLKKTGNVWLITSPKDLYWLY